MVAQRRYLGKGPFLRVSLNRPVSTSRRLSLSESWRALAGCGCFRFGGGNQTIANSSLAGDLASAANSFRFLPDFSFRRLFIGGPELHLSEYSLALHFFLQEFQRLIDVIVADCNEQNISDLILANRRRGTRSRHATPRSPSFAPLSQRHDSTFCLPVSEQIVLPAFRSSPLTSKCWIFDPSSGAKAEVGNAPL